MKNIDKKFVPVMERFQHDCDDEGCYGDGYGDVIREMLPMEGESIIESLIRSRYVISEDMIRCMTYRSGSITPESVNKCIGRKNGYIVPVILPHRINVMLGMVEHCTSRCSIDDGIVVYNDGFDMDPGLYGKIGVESMHTITHAIVVGNALLMSDQVSEDDNRTVIDRLNYIDDSDQRVYMWSCKHDDDSHLSFKANCLNKYRRYDLNDTAIGARMYKELRESVDDDMLDEERIYMYYLDGGVMEILNLSNNIVMAIIRYCLELWKDHENNHILPSYYIDEMTAYIDHYRWSIMFLARDYVDIISEIDEYEKSSDK